MKKFSFFRIGENCMEIERKYLIDKLPFDVTVYPSHEIEQAYLNTEPVLRVRRQDETYYLTYKSKGLMAREEYNLPLNADAYAHLLEKADGMYCQRPGIRFLSVTI